MAGRKPHVIASAALPVDVGSILGDAATYFEPAQGQLSAEELLVEVSGAQGLISLLTDRVDRRLLQAAPELAVVANFAVGYDNIDLAAASSRGVVVTNTPDVLTEATADFTFALLLAAARGIVEGDRLVREGRWTGWHPSQHLGADVGGATLGILGLGRIGRAVARRARGFGMTILAASRVGAEAEAQAETTPEGVTRVSLGEILARADFLSLHCPLNRDTHQIIDRDALALMKPTAILVNTARGGCVDEDALVGALDSGGIAGAGLDVFAEEPAVHPGLRASNKVILAPHAGSATYTARRRMGEICANAVAAVLAGRRPSTVINPRVYGDSGTAEPLRPAPAPDGKRGPRT